MRRALITSLREACWRPAPGAARHLRNAAAGPRRKNLLAFALFVLVACSSHPPHAISPASGSGSASAVASGSGSGSAATPPAVDDPPLPLWAKVTKGVLPNGLTYYVLHHEKPAQRAYMWLAVNAGSLQEDDDQQGLAHLCEHMAFNGSKNFPHQDIVDYLEKIGMDFGADVNAYTDYAETVYQLEVPTDKPEFVDKGLDILHDWAGSVTYDKDEVDKERGVVLEEWRRDRGAFTRVQEKESKILFQGSRYADRDPIGKPDIIQHASRDTLYRFYQDWYRPDLMAVIVVGDLDPATIAKQIEDKFGDLVNPAKERPREDGGVPNADGMRVSIQTDKELTTPYVTIDNTFAHQRESTALDYRSYIREQLYHSMLDARLDEASQRPDAPFLWASSGTDNLNRETEAFVRTAGAKEGQVEATLTALLTEVERVERHGFSADELDRAKKDLMRGIVQDARGLEKRDGRDLVEEIKRNFLENEEMPGRDAEVELYKKYLDGITLDELDKLADQWGGDENRVILLAGPDGEVMPSEARVKEIVASVAKTDPGPWTQSTSVDQLMTAPPAPGTVTSETTDAKHDVTVWTLGNGVRVVVKPTQFESDQVMIRAVSPGGTATASDADFQTARFAAEVVNAGGVGNLSQQDLRKVLAGKVVSVVPWIDDTQEGIEAKGASSDLETIMQLINLTMTSPRKDDQAFAVWKQSTTQWVAQRRKSPEEAFNEDMGKVLTESHKRLLPVEQSDVDQVDLDKAIAFYKDRFGDAGDFLFVIVGDVQLDALKPMVAQYLGSLPASGRVEKEKDLRVKRPKGVVKKKLAQGEEDKAEVEVSWFGDAKWSRPAARDLDMLTDVLDLELNSILREDMGGTYGVSVWGDLTRGPHEERQMTVDFNCAPDNVAKLEKALFTEIADIKKHGAPEADLDKVRSERKRGRETDLQNNGVWVSWLTEAYYYDDSLDSMLDIDANIARITNKNLKAAAKRFAPDNRYVIGELLPEKK